mgnify:FL=1
MSVDEVSGLGGWLPVVGMSIVFGLIGVIANTYTYSQIFSDGTWEALTTPGTDVYNPLWAPVIIGQLIFNSALALAYICLICLFFTKHYLFPKVCIASMAVTLVYIPLRGWVGTFVVPDKLMFDPETTEEFTRTLTGAVIWIPYMLVSKRVKATFVEISPYHT